MVSKIVPILALLMLVGCSPSTSTSTSSPSTTGTATSVTTPTPTPTPTLSGSLDMVTDHSLDAFYSMDLYVGGETFPDVLIDTASSNLILFGNSTVCPTCSQNTFPDFTPTTYTPSSQPLDNGQTFTIKYGIGQGTVALYQDNVGLLANGPTVSYPIGVFVSGTQVQNILGLGYAANVATVQGTQPPLPFFETYAQQTGLQTLFSINLCPDGQNGSFMTFDTIDSAVPTSSINYTTILQDSLLQQPTYDYYNVSAQTLSAVSASGQVTSLASFPTQQSDFYLTVVDSGTSLLYLTQSMVNAIATYYQGKPATSQIPTSFWNLNPKKAETITPAQFSTLDNLQITFPSPNGGTFTVTLTPDTYIINANTAAAPEYVSGMTVAAAPTNTMPGIVLLGQPFLQNVYAVFNQTTQQLGFAPNQALCNSSSTVSAQSEMRAPLMGRHPLHKRTHISS